MHQTSSVHLAQALALCLLVVKLVSVNFIILDYLQGLACAFLDLSLHCTPDVELVLLSLTLVLVNEGVVPNGVVLSSSA